MVNMLRNCLFVLLLSYSLPSVADQPNKADISAHLTKCASEGVAANLVAKFGTDYSGLDLSGLDFRGVYAIGKSTDLRGADFTGANLNGAQFGNVNLAGAKFNDADLTGASFHSAKAHRADFRGANLEGAEFPYATLESANLQKADLSKSEIAMCDFSRADLTDAVLAGATSQYWGLNFSKANLTRADLSGLELQHAHFTGANLESADLSAADLSEADFAGAVLTGANLEEASIRATNFADAKGLPDAELERLRDASGRWSFEAKRGMLAFLESPLFAMMLLVLMPVFAVGYRMVSKRNATKEHVTPNGPRYSLANMLVAAFLVCTFLGLATQTMYAAFMFLAVAGFYLMIGEIIYGKRKVGSMVFGAAMALLVLNVIIIFALGSVKPFLIFTASPLFFLVHAVITLIAAAVGLILLLGNSTTEKPVRWLAPVGLFLWSACAAIANGWIFAQASAAV